MTKYDVLAPMYDGIMNVLTMREIELHSIQNIVGPLLKEPGTKVLELACGTGFYTSRLLAWGASSVTAIDISPMMLEQAVQKTSCKISGGQARFVLADGSKPKSFAPDGTLAYFDVVFGAWFLNYAQTRGELTAMFENISLNLKPGGVFVGITLHPTDRLSERAAAYSNPPLSLVLPRNCYTHELDSKDGWELHVYLHQDGTYLECWHLKKEVYERAARDGGMKGTLYWSEEAFSGEDCMRRTGLLTQMDMAMRKEHPHLGVIVAYRS